MTASHQEEEKKKDETKEIGEGHRPSLDRTSFQ